MRNAAYLAAFVAVMALSTDAAAQSSTSAEIAAIRGEIASLIARLERLEQTAGVEEAAPSAAPAATVATSAAATPAAEVVVADVPPAVRFAGDLRYRHESIDAQDAIERNRHRIRARFGVTADVAENVRLGLTLASGEDDPVSANQTLDGGFDRNSIGIDRAFFTWAATDELSFTGGKMATPFYRPGSHHLIYDNDLNPEGLALRYSRGDWFVNYAGLWVEERSASDDSIMLGGQLGYRHMLDNGMRITTGVGYFDYLNTQGQTPFWNGDPSGNRVTTLDQYVNDFNLAQAFGELKLDAGQLPLTVFADFVTNTEAGPGDDTGYALGASIGEVDEAGTWRFGYIYQDLEADAVIGTFTDSDWAGGGTNGKGHVVEFNYGFRDRLVFGLRYFLNERGLPTGGVSDYNRLQADVQFNY
jgi:hypothetical protein